MAQNNKLEEFIVNFDLVARNDMRINSKELVALLKSNEVILVDIRFEEEYRSWNMPIAINIPLSKLPESLDKLESEKLIITACPHKDRAIIAFAYLKEMGYKVKYLSDGLTGMAEYLRGENVLVGS